MDDAGAHGLPFRAPWQHPDLLPPKRLNNGSFGVFDGNCVVEMSLEGIRDIIRMELGPKKTQMGMPFILLEHPDHSRLVTRFGCPELGDVLSESIRKHAQTDLRKGLWMLPVLILCGIGVAMGFGGPLWWGCLYGIQSLEAGVTGLQLKRRIERDPTGCLQWLDTQVRYDYWVGRYPWRRAWRSLGVAALMVTIFIGQLFVGLDLSVTKAGLVKARALGGEPWRLLTGPLMHASVMHLFFNGVSWIAMAPMVERVINPRLLLPAFILCVLGGSLASTALLSASSVGASGGLAGLLGLLGIVFWRRASLFPEGQVISLLPSILNMILLGLMGWRFIDNAAHLGGLLTGMLLGWMVTMDDRGPLPLANAGWVRIIDGVALLGVLWASGHALRLFFH